MEGRKAGRGRGKRRKKGGRKGEKRINTPGSGHRRDEEPSSFGSLDAASSRSRQGII